MDISAALWGNALHIVKIFPSIRFGNERIQGHEARKGFFFPGVVRFDRSEFAPGFEYLQFPLLM